MEESEGEEESDTNKHIHLVENQDGAMQAKLRIATLNIDGLYKKLTWWSLIYESVYSGEVWLNEGQK